MFLKNAGGGNPVLPPRVHGFPGAAAVEAEFTIYQEHSSPEASWVLLCKALVVGMGLVVPSSSATQSRGAQATAWPNAALWSVGGGLRLGFLCGPWRGSQCTSPQLVLCTDIQDLAPNDYVEFESNGANSAFRSMRSYWFPVGAMNVPKDWIWSRKK